MSNAKTTTTAAPIALYKEEIRQHLKTILRAAWKTSTAATTLRADEQGMLPAPLSGDQTFREIMIGICYEGSDKTMSAVDEILKVLGLDGSKLFDDESELNRGAL